MAKISQNSPLNGMLQLKEMISAIRSKDANLVALNMLKTNPQFRSFYEQNKDLSVEQIASKYNIDLNMVRDLLK